MKVAVRPVIVSVVLAATIMLSTGCGTLVNLAGTVVPITKDREWPMVYGGVQFDASMLQRGPLFSMSAGGDKDGLAALAFLGLYFADFGASFVGDTLTLPVVLAVYRVREWRREDVVAAPPPQMEPPPTSPKDEVNSAEMTSAPENVVNPVKVIADPLDGSRVPTRSGEQEFPLTPIFDSKNVIVVVNRPEVVNPFPRPRPLPPPDDEAMNPSGQLGPAWLKPSK